MERRKRLKQHLDFLRKNITEKLPGPGCLVIATYTREEFEELRPNDDYDEFKKDERCLAEMAAAEKLLPYIRFEFIDSVDFYKFIAEKGLTNDEKTRAYYASIKAAQNGQSGSGGVGPAITQ